MKTNQFQCIKSLIDSVIQVGGRLTMIQDRNCLIAPEGYLFNLSEETIVYSGVGLSLEEEFILIPAGRMLNSDKGITTYGTGIIRPLNVKNVTIDIVPH